MKKFVETAWEYARLALVLGASFGIIEFLYWVGK